MEPLSPRAVNIQTKPRPTLKAYVNTVKTQAAPRAKDPVPKPPPVVVQPPISQGSLSDKYKIGNHLGKGGFAVCYEGELQCRKYNMQDRIYALKTVPAKMNNKKMEEKFRTELQIHAKLHHPNIVEFHRAFTYMDNTYLVLELCRSGSVMDLVKKRGCLSLPEVRRITVQLCGAVKYMHSRNVIHRDLKMGNLFLDHDMNLKLGDFGLAAVLVSKGEYDGVYDKKFSRRTTMCGTPNYIAPEILEKSKGGHDHKVDIWAIGVILFAMITGFPPFQATSQDEIYRKAKTVEYDWPDSGSNTRRCHNDIPTEAKDLVACLLKVDAETRPNPDEIIGQSFFSMHGGNAMPLTLDPSCRRQKPFWLLDEAPRGDVMDRLTPRLELNILARQCGVGHLNGDTEPYEVVGDNVDISLYKECVAEEKAETSPVVPLPMDMVYTSAISLRTWPNQRSPSPESVHPAQTVSGSKDCIARLPSVEDISQQQQQVPQAPKNVQLRRAPVPSHAATLRAAQVGSMPTRGLPRTISGVGQLQDSMKNLDLQNHSRRIPTRRLLNELPVRPSALTTSSGTLQTVVAPRQSSRVTRSAATKALASQPNVVAQTSESEPSESDKKRRERSAKTEARIAATVQEEIEEAILGQKGPRRQKRSQPAKTKSEKSRHSVLISPDEVAETLVGTTPEDVCRNLRRLSDEIKRNLDCPRHDEQNLDALLATGKRSAKDRPVIIKWVDYSHRFGIGYILENGTVGSVLRGDNGTPTTCLTVAGAESHLRKRKSPNYVDKHQVLSKDGSPVAFFEDCGDEGIRRVLVPSRKYHLRGSRGTSEEFRQAVDGYDSEKRDRLCIWDKFGRYMTQSLGKSDGPDPHACSSDKETHFSAIEPIGPFIRFYQRLGNVGVWGFGDGSFQINFPDHTKVVISHDGTWVDFYHLSLQAAQTLKRGEILEAASLVERSVLRYPTNVILSGSYRGYDFQRLITENQLPEKLAFFREVVDAWHDGGGLGCMGSKNEVRWEGMSEKGGKLVWVTVGAHGGDGKKWRQHGDYDKFKSERGVGEYSTGTGTGNALYGPRIQHAQILLGAETLAQEVEKNVTLSQSSQSHWNTSSTPRDAHLTYAAKRFTAEQDIVEERTETILTRADMLRRTTEELKDYITRKKAELSERRSTLGAASKRLSERPRSDLEPLEKGTKRTERQWDALHSKTAEARSFLCKEAAQLYGLQQRKRKKGTPGRDLYLVGGILICDLRDLNNASPSQISTFTTNLAHLTHLVSHYLGLRLPAEITLPHRDYPLPTIFSPGSSYGSREAPFPGLTPAHSSNNSPSASRTADQGPTPRPRPLYLDKKLPSLAKDDPVAYANFVEGVTLLAWDIAWMCKTQGLDIGSRSWEDVCAIGKNLWQLLLAPPPPLRRPPSVRDLLVPTTAHSGNLEVAASRASLGHFSHSTTHSFLSASEGVDYMNGWRLQSHFKVIDKVKAMLLSERDGAEWQILEENEWEEGTIAIEPSRDDGGTRKTGEETVLIEGVPKAALQTEPDNRPGVEGAPNGEDDPERMRGTSGWTKLKSRGTQ